MNEYKQKIYIYHLQPSNIPELLKAIIKRGKKIGLYEDRYISDSEIWDALENIVMCKVCKNTMKGLRSSARIGNKIDYLVMCKTCKVCGSALVERFD